VLAVEPASVPEAVEAGALVLVALPLAVPEVSAAMIGVAKEATNTVAARTARVRLIKVVSFLFT
jgi:hypothetical protein